MALDVLLPPHCPCCGAAISAHGQICAGCFAALNFIVAPLCRSCGLPFGSAAEAGRDGLCGRCRARPPAWSRARAAFLYDDASRRLILPLKYADRQENALVLAKHMARAAGPLLDQADLLVPVPLHRWRLFRRGFNQAALLTRALQKRSGGSGRCERPVCLDMLQRTRRTRVLGMLSAAERAAELAGAISVRASRTSLLHGKRVVLVDDVLTTGSTIGACARALLDAGASHIDVVVAARVADPRAHEAFGDTGQDDEMDKG